MKKNITTAAKVIRSKNAGPFELTFDIIFKNKDYFQKFKTEKIINKPMIAELLKIEQEKILGIIWFEPANAVKITIIRPMPSGAPGETDIYGAQQHAPLLEIEF